MWRCLTCHKVFSSHRGAVMHQAVHPGHRITNR